MTQRSDMRVSFSFLLLRRGEEPSRPSITNEDLQSNSSFLVHVYPGVALCTSSKLSNNTKPRTSGRDGVVSVNLTFPCTLPPYRLEEMINTQGWIYQPASRAKHEPSMRIFAIRRDGTGENRATEIYFPPFVDVRYRLPTGS